MITCIAYCEQRNLVFAVVGFSTVLVKEVAVIGPSCKFISSVASIRSKMAVTNVVPNKSGTRIMLQGPHSAEMWTTTGDNVGVGFSLTCDSSDGRSGDRKILNHPLDPDCFTFVSRICKRIFSWNQVRAEPCAVEEHRQITTTTVPSPGAKTLVQRGSLPCVAYFAHAEDLSTFDTVPAMLKVWAASSISISFRDPRPLPLYGFEKLVPKIHHIIAVTHSNPVSRHRLLGLQFRHEDVHGIES